MSTKVLFLCPHAAGKSILAATYLRAAASRRGIDVTVTTAGTDPDDEVMPNVRASLEAQGFAVDRKPVLVGAEDLEAAGIIVSIGCDHDDIPTTKPVTDWDVPMLSEDFAGSVAAIHARAEELALALSRPGTMSSAG